VAAIRTVAVIGAGVSGRGIACAAVLGGYHTILEDILPASLRKAEAEIRANLTNVEQALARIDYASTVEEAARQADLVIEAVPDELESKIEIFTLLDKVCKPETILVLNSFTLSITEIASVTYRPQKCIGMRFSNPVQEMTRLELVRGQDTSEETVNACAEVGKRMGRQIIIVGPFENLTTDKTD
jgi:3-hydroxybutyryl-CoA dehydrogenase